MRIHLGFVAATAVCVSCTSTPARDNDATAYEEEGRVCVNARTANTFDAFSDRYVYVGAQADKHYLLVMRNRCNSLRFANGIAIKDATSRVCADGFGEIVYRDTGRLVSCRIGDIQVVESKEDARAIVEQLEKGGE
jgi:hypothetical protein